MTVVQTGPESHDVEAEEERREKSCQERCQPDTEPGYNNNISSILESSVPSFRKTRPSAMDFLTTSYICRTWLVDGGRRANLST